MKPKNGFTPLEVLIALFILMIGVVAVFKLFPIALQQVRVAQERAVSTELADTTLGRLQMLGGRSLLTQSGSGAMGRFLAMNRPVGSAAGMYEAYAASVQRMAGASRSYLQRVTFTVDLPEGRYERFVTYVADP